MFHCDDLESVISCCDRLNRARRVFIIAGPGISTSAGIPDLGSGKWLFDKSKTPEDVLDGRRLVNKDKAKELYSDLLAVYTTIAAASPTDFHLYMARLHKYGKLARVYTQNIDGLEDKAGLPSRDFKYHERTTDDQDENVPGSYLKSDFVTVHLHGSIRHAWCDKCNLRMPIEEDDMRNLNLGIGVNCPECGDKRSPQGLRQIGQRTLKTDVTLYNELPSSEIHDIVNLVDIPALCSGDVIIFAGTSARTVEFQKLVIAFCQAMCHRRAKEHWEGSYPGQCDVGDDLETDNIFWVSKTAPPDDLVAYIDVFIDFECDVFAECTSHRERQLARIERSIQEWDDQRLLRR